MLGPVEVRTDAGEPVHVPEAKVRALLAVLLAFRGEAVSSDRLVEELWPGHTPTDPRTALQAKVSQLRRALDVAEPGGRGLVVSQAGGYALRGGSHDAGDFAAALETARSEGTPERRAEVLDRALRRWRGPAFGGPDDGAIAREAARLDELRLVAREDHAAAVLDGGGGAELVADLSVLLDAHPLRERLVAVWMRALYRAGRAQDALAAYRDLARRLRDELGTDPGPELEALHRSVLAHDTALSAPTGAPRPATGATALPVPVTALVGRADEQRRVASALDTHRLVTLVGPGGVGKTRLALEVAHADGGGARFAELDALPAGAATQEVETVIAAAFGVRACVDVGGDGADRGCTTGGQLVNALRAGAELLVLDNCEHVLDAAAVVAADLVAAAPGLRILATSRESLDIAGEAVVPVGPLGTDGADAPAATLFVARARAADPAADVDPAVVAEICRTLDGVPLALELAAAQVRAVGVRGLLARLDDRFAVLRRRRAGAGPARQRTLRATLDWSWELLDGDERIAARRLAPAAAGCTPAAAGALIDLGPSRGADLVARLVDSSWLTADDGPGGRRLHMLESVAAYVAEALSASGEDRAVRDRHLAHQLATAEHAAGQLRGPDQRAWLARMDAEAPGRRGALDHAAATGQAGAALRLVAASCWYWFLRGRLDEALRAAEVALTQPGQRSSDEEAVVRVWRDALLRWSNTGPVTERSSPTSPLPLPARWFDAYSRFPYEGVAQQRARLSALVSEARADHDRWVEAASLVARSGVHLLVDDVGPAVADAAAAGELFAAIGDRWGLLQVATELGTVAVVRGDHREALRRHREALRIAEELGLHSEQAGLHGSIGRVMLATGDFDAAEKELRAAAEHARRQGVEALVEYAEFGRALALRRRGDLDGAEQLLRARVEGPGAPGAAAPMTALPSIELGFVAELRGDAQGALDWHRRGHRAAVSSGSPRTIALALEGLAGAAALRGDHHDAARLLGSATSVRQRLDAPLGPGERGDVDRIRAGIVAALGARAERAAEAAAEVPDDPADIAVSTAG